MLKNSTKSFGLDGGAVALLLKPLGLGRVFLVARGGTDWINEVENSRAENRTNEANFPWIAARNGLYATCNSRNGIYEKKVACYTRLRKRKLDT